MTWLQAGHETFIGDPPPKPVPRRRWTDAFAQGPAPLRESGERDLARGPNSIGHRAETAAIGECRGPKLLSREWPGRDSISGGKPKKLLVRGRVRVHPVGPGGEVCGYKSPAGV